MRCKRKNIGFYVCLLFLSFINREICGMKIKEIKEEKNCEEIFNNNYCIADKDGDVLNLSDLKELNLYKEENKNLEKLNEQLNNQQINIVEYCTATENTIKFRVIENEEEVIEDITYFLCIDKREYPQNKEQLCGGIVNDKILITKEGKLKNFERQKKKINNKNILFLVKKPAKEFLIFDKAFQAKNAKNIKKTKFEVFLLYPTIRKEIEGQKNLNHNQKFHIFLFGNNKLFYYWDETKQYIYLFQYYTGQKVLHEKPLQVEVKQNLKKEENIEIYEIYDKQFEKVEEEKILEIKKNNKKNFCSIV